MQSLGLPKFGNIFAVLRGIRISETSLHGIFGGFRNSETSLCFSGVSEFRKLFCVLSGYPNFGNIFVFFRGIRNLETSFHSLGVSEIRKQISLCF